MFEAWFRNTEPIKLEPYKGDLKGVDGWLSREGVFYRCNYVDHSIYADKLCKKYGYQLLNSFPLSMNGEYTLEKKGWAKISNGKVHYANEKPLSKKQLDFLFDYFICNGYSVNEYNELVRMQEVPAPF
ncbi:hypothetical protein [Desulfallas thermosapovorans]|uniref:Uncharacterized protein n=1 Tax=Desulfallas thermosapovorans DSM 6562 TaxID=1121431 RepID=A0A5S4ZSL1_9FIRM|nr:hypothetical protein [Desulfallas thermosapovorans]TYO95936.1 hypothetical protein LX24_01326 [Desulfallas thermosapovorans DSM 6562]